MVDLSSLTTLIGGLGRPPFVSPNDVRINASGGGLVDLSGLPETSRQVFVTVGGADSTGTPSRVDLTSLTAIRAGGRGSGLTVNDVGVLSVPNLDRLETTNLIASGGGQLALPAATFYTGGGDSRTSLINTIRADGAGSAIDLGALTTLVGALGSPPFVSPNDVNLRAVDGGVLDLSAVTDMSRQIQITSSGTGSLVQLTSLSTFGNEDSTRRSVMTADQAGEIRLNPLQNEFRGRSALIAETGRVEAGTFVVDVGADMLAGGTLSGNLVNRGTLRAGAGVGTLAAEGDYTQSFEGTLEVEIAGLTPGTAFDLLNVTGHAALSGTLSVLRPGGFTPAFGDRFEVLTFASRSGDFHTRNWSSFGGLTFAPLFGTGGMELVVVEDIPPTIGSLSASSEIVLPGDNLTLTADPVSDVGGAVEEVLFFFDANSNGTLDWASDTLLAVDTQGSDGWSAAFSTAGIEPGTRRFFAQARDDDNLLGNIASDTALFAFVVDSTADAVDANPGDGKSDDGTGRSTLRSAVMETNRLSGPDAIFLPAGRYELSLAGTGGHEEGDLDIVDDLIIFGAGAGASIIDANGIDRIFDPFGGQTVSFSDLSLTGGSADQGGALRINRGDRVTLENVEIRNNSASQLGGAIDNFGRLTILQSRIEENSANAGGGIFNRDKRFGGSMTIVDSTIAGNVAGNQGGGIVSGSPLSIERTTISGNQALNQVAAIDNFDSLLLVNSTISGNTSDHFGAIKIRSGATGSLLNVTITGNHSDAEVSGVFNNGNLTIKNTIIAGNGAISGLPDVGGANAFDSQGHSIIGNVGSASGFTDGVNGDQVGTSTDPLDPRLGPLADNGGPTLTHALLAGSPAIDTGTVQEAPATDQRGVLRPQGFGVDVGAFELENRPPTAEAGGPYFVPENGSVRLDASATADLDQDPATLLYEWDLDGDGIFGETGSDAIRGDEVGIKPTFSAAGLDGPSSLTVALRVTDDGGLTDNDIATVEITNAAPTATDDSTTVAEDGSVVLDVLGNDTDPAGALDPMAITGAANGRHGTVVVAADGLSLTYIPDADFFGADSFTYTIDDGDGGSDTATVNVTVTEVNDAPTANPDAVTVAEGNSVTIDVLSNDSPGPANESQQALTVVSASASNGIVVINPDQTLTYTPIPDFNGQETIHYTIEDNGTTNGVSDPLQATSLVDVTVLNVVDLSGRVFDDRDNDGAFEPADGETGLAGVVIELVDESTGTVAATSVTDSAGTYEFDFAGLGLGTGSFTVRQQSQPRGFLDGLESTGDLGGEAGDNGSTVDGRDSNAITGIVIREPGTQQDTAGYDFAEIQPSSIQGLVWEDFDDDGEVDFGEFAIGGVNITLSGTDDRGDPVNLSQTTDGQGIFEFVGLRPSDSTGYTITQTQPDGFIDGKDVVGKVNGQLAGDNDGGDPALSTTNDAFTSVVLAAPASTGINYNFGERVDGGTVSTGQTATIGFWQNRNGQRLIESLNGGAQSTLLAQYLSGTFSNMYGMLADADGDGITDENGDGAADDFMTNAAVADLYQMLFKRNRRTSPGGPPKLDAQVMATALATYVTKESFVQVDFVTSTVHSSLVDEVESFGFEVTVGGVGSTFVNVGGNGQAFGVADDSDVQIIDLLLATDSMSAGGLLYDANGDGFVDDDEELDRIMANDIYSLINEL